MVLKEKTKQKRVWQGQHFGKKPKQRRKKFISNEKQSQRVRQ